MRLFEEKYETGEKPTLLGAFECGKRVDFVLKIPRENGTVSVKMDIRADGLLRDFSKTVPLLWTSLDGSYDVYRFTLDTSELGVGLYYYKYEVTSFGGKEYYASRGHGGKLERLSSDDGLMQLIVFESTKNTPEWLYGGIIYHIFVDRFRKSGKCAPKDYAIMNDDWEGGIPQFADKPGGYVENNMFFGGDLYGVIEKLDYINSLGVNCIYLSPIFEAYSNHKYDTADYMSIDSMFGGEEAFSKLIKEAKKRGIRIILDGVFNHTGSDSIYFNKNGRYKELGAYQSKKSKYFEWYNFRSFPDDYECWWNVKILPRVNSDKESYRKFILGDGGVIEKWAKKGVAGFRLDVADELSDSFLSELNSKLKSICPDGMVYGEVWEDASNKIAYDKRKKYFLGGELDSVMNYPVREALIKFIKYGDTSVADVCETLYSHYPKNASDLLMNVLGTHDTERILTVLGTDGSEKYTNKELSVKKMTEAEVKEATALLKIAYTLIATLPGIPCIYYGDEAGMQGYRDPFNRMPYPWGKENTELIELYKSVGALRRAEKLYRKGLFKVIFCNSDVFAFARYDEKSFVLTVANRSERKYTLKSDCTLKNVLTNRKINSILPRSACILKSDKPIDRANIEFL